MARTLAEVRQQMIDQVAADPVLSGVLKSTSNKSVFYFWITILAAAIVIFEGLADVFRAQTAASVADNIVGTSLYLRNISFLFQYSLTNRQNLDVTDYFIRYPKVDASLRIINICSISVSSNLVIFNVAKVDASQNITTLNADQLASFQAYVDLKTPATGNVYQVKSNPADKIYFEANIIYKNSYNIDTVRANIKEAAILYLNTTITNNVPNSPIVDGNDFISAIKKADGFAKFADGNGIVNLFFRADGVPLRNAADTDFNPDQNLIRLIFNTDIMKFETQLVAGYCVTENTAGYTFMDKVILTPN